MPAPRNQPSRGTEPNKLPGLRENISCAISLNTCFGHCFRFCCLLTHSSLFYAEVLWVATKREYASQRVSDRRINLSLGSAFDPQYRHDLLLNLSRHSRILFFHVNVHFGTDSEFG